MKGFVQDGTLQSKEIIKSSRCGACALFKRKGCNSPKMGVVGKGEKGILFVLPPVHEQEDELGKYLITKQGRWLSQILQQQGIDPIRDCWFTSSLICHSPKFDNENVDYCRFILDKTIQNLKPISIIPMGKESIRSVIYLSSNIKVKDPNRWIHWRIPSQWMNTWIMPTHSYYGEQENSLVLRRFKKHVLAAIEPKKRPWKEIPKWEEAIHILNETQALKFIAKLTASKEAFAFDYETTTLKPEGPASEIASVAISIRGRVTAAFSWNQRVAASMGHLLRNPAYKVAANCKFEERWTRKVLGISVRNWAWDTMQASHCLDNRQGITSVEFNAFILLGFPNYAEDIKPYLRSEGSYSPNQIFQIPLSKLLKYNGLDALLEWKMAEKQIVMMDHPIRRKLKI